MGCYLITDLGYSLSGLLCTGLFIVKWAYRSTLWGSLVGDISIPHPALEKRRLGGKNAEL